MPHDENTNFPTKLAKPAQRALASAGIVSLEQLADWTETDLMKLHGMGPKALKQLLDALEEKGLSIKK
ncbi:DNA-binding protein [Fictibacillus phosphorivorans]|uniref:DNA-binding protein n=1 Tax=Fictibacillus phosphorivorans TaxID=1221500 RepID=A0A163SJP3_9BACL|nr:helix-hairpin-helix domain-containing protein [Fictibacillus phosphorivorans]KZE69249.1 DNA-binding protein [Fictibacillus phosphorivorans]